MTDTKPTETVEDLIRQLDDRCTELSEAESMIEMLKAGATELRLALSTLQRIALYEVGGPRGEEMATIIRDVLRDYNQRCALWDKLHPKPWQDSYVSCCLPCASLPLPHTHSQMK